MKAYFLISDSLDGWQNLAQDEYILDHVKNGEIYLYIYINADSVIIGKNQNAWKECNLSAMEKCSIMPMAALKIQDSSILKMNFI